MSVTVSDILMLPSLSGAEVVAGHAGLDKAVETVSVLEYADITDQLDQLFDSNCFEGSELFLTAFSNIRNDIEAQCANIKHYHSVGASGFIIYYIGFFLPQIDQQLIDLCNELECPLICMPKGKLNLQYNETIAEIMFEIFRKRQKERYFVSDLLERISNLPEHQRNMDALLRMLSGHLHASVILRHSVSNDFTFAFWPRAIAGTVNEHLEQWLNELSENKSIKISLGEGDGYLQRCPCLSASAREHCVYLLKYGDPLEEDILLQISELIRLYIHIWNKNHGKLVISELVRTIVNNDVLQMKRLSELFHVDTSTLNQMWLFYPKSAESDSWDENLLQKSSKWYGAFSSTVLTSYYESNLVVFVHAAAQYSQRQEAFSDLEEKLTQLNQYDVVCWDRLPTVTDAQKAYVDIMNFINAARKIHPRKRILSSSDIMFAKQCQSTLENHDSLQQYMRILEQLNETEALLPTAEIYLLDASSNMAQTAKLLYVHLNTVKYRLHSIQDVLGYWPGKMPDAYPLYIAVSLNRLLNS